MKRATIFGYNEISDVDQDETEDLIINECATNSSYVNFHRNADFKEAYPKLYEYMTTKAPKDDEILVSIDW